MANLNKVGLVIGALIGGWHVIWALLVLIGWAQPIIDFIFWAHMIQPIYVVKPFDPLAAVALIVITSVIGYIFGLLGAVIWNRLHRRWAGAQKMEGFWQPMPSSGGQGSSWYRYEKTEYSKYSRADRFLKDVDRRHQNR